MLVNVIDPFPHGASGQPEIMIETAVWKMFQVKVAVSGKENEDR